MAGTALALIITCISEQIVRRTKVRCGDFHLHDSYCGRSKITNELTDFFDIVQVLPCQGEAVTHP